jgi:hypothetical protein
MKRFRSDSGAILKRLSSNNEAISKQSQRFNDNRSPIANGSESDSNRFNLFRKQICSDTSATPQLAK